MAFALLFLLFFLSIAADRSPSKPFSFSDLAIATALFSLMGGLLVSSIFGN